MSSRSWDVLCRIKKTIAEFAPSLPTLPVWKSAAEFGVPLPSLDDWRRVLRSSELRLDDRCSVRKFSADLGRSLLSTVDCCRVQNITAMFAADFGIPLVAVVFGRALPIFLNYCLVRNSASKFGMARCYVGKIAIAFEYEISSIRSLLISEYVC